MTTPYNDVCTDCDLYHTANHPVVPMRAYALNDRCTAILFVGEAPGAMEDAQHTCWIGQSGKLLTQFIDASTIPQYADVYGKACSML